MAVSHAKVLTQGDFTGTVTVFGSNGSTATANATDLARVTDWNSAHNQYLSVTGNTSGQSTFSGTNIVFGGGANITLSGVNATRVDIVGPTPGGGGNVSRYIPPAVYAVHVAGQVGQNSVFVAPVDLPSISFGAVLHKVQYTNATNSSGSVTVSMHVGLYTLNGSTLSSVATTSSSHATSNSGTAGAMSLWLGMRILPVGWSTSVPAGAYYVAVMSRTTTAGAAGMTMSQYLASQITTVHSGFLGQSANASRQHIMGLGTWSQSTTALPGTMALSNIAGASSAGQRQPIFWFDAITV